MKAEANRLIAYHSPIAKRLTLERTSYTSQLIPVTAYILVACVEAWYRYPELVRIIDAARPAEAIGAAGRRPGSRINTVHLWSIVNFWLLGRKVAVLIDPDQDDAADAYAVLDFWDRAAGGFRADGTRQAADADGVVRPYDDDIIETLLAGVEPVAGEARDRIRRFNATLVNDLFLLYFDTRVGSGDTGPYALPDGRTLLVRDFYRMSETDYWWSDVARDVPYQNLTAALVLDDVELRITDFGTANTTPEDYLERLSGFSLFTSDNPDGSLRPVPLDELDDLVAVVRQAQAAHYRNVAAMSRDEMIRCGAYVYFTFLRPFADVAGVDDQLDWTAPRDIAEPFYQVLSMTEGDDAVLDPDADYYTPIP
jgi:hypothetical protein